MDNAKPTKQYLKETIQINLDPHEYGDFLDKLHTHFTELAPTRYYNHNVIEVENHHTQNRYSVRGEERLDVPIQKRLVYQIEDGSSITIQYDELSNTTTISLDVIGKSLSNLLNKSSTIRKTLLSTISFNLEKCNKE